MTRTLGGSMYAVVFREEMRKNRARCVIAQDPRVPDAIGYGDDESDATEMLDIVRADILARSAVAPLVVETALVPAAPAVSEVVIGGWQIFWGAGAVQHA